MSGHSQDSFGAKSNSCTFNRNLIRALNCFSAQPLSALTVSLFPKHHILVPFTIFLLLCLLRSFSIFIITAQLSVSFPFYPYHSHGLTTILSLIPLHISLAFYLLNLLITLLDLPLIFSFQFHIFPFFFFGNHHMHFYGFPLTAGGRVETVFQSFPHSPH